MSIFPMSYTVIISTFFCFVKEISGYFTHFTHFGIRHHHKPMVVPKSLIKQVKIPVRGFVFTHFTHFILKVYISILMCVIYVCKDLGLCPNPQGNDSLDLTYQTPPSPSTH